MDKTAPQVIKPTAILIALFLLAYSVAFHYFCLNIPQALRHRITILITLLLLSLSLNAQKETADDNIGIVYRKENTIGGYIHTNGFGAMYRTGVFVDGFKRRFWQFDIFNIKHPKEGRTINPFYENSRGFIYGKLNSLTNLSASRTWQRTLYSKSYGTGIEIRYHYSAGVNLGLFKPVYLRVINTGADSIVVEPYNPNKHQLINILGRGGLFSGFGNIKPRPGLHLTSGFSFDFSQTDNKVWAIELGAQFDIFALPEPIMANNPNKPWFLNFYLAILYGSKKN
jgi:hypothetical protein